MQAFARALGAALLVLCAAGCGLPLPDGQPGTLPIKASVQALGKYGVYPGTTPTALWAHSAKWFSTEAKSASSTMLTDDEPDVVQAYYEKLAKQDGWTWYAMGALPKDPTRFCTLSRGKEKLEASIYAQDPQKPAPTPGPNDLPGETPPRAKTGSKIMLFVIETD